MRFLLSVKNKLKVSWSHIKVGLTFAGLKEVFFPFNFLCTCIYVNSRTENEIGSAIICAVMSEFV